MMKYLTRPARSEPEYEQVAMGNYIKGGKKLLEQLIKKGKVKKGEAPKTDINKVQSKVEADQKNIQELADNNQIPVKSEIPEPFAGKFEEEFVAHDNMFGRRSGDNKVDAQEIAEQVAEARGQDYYNLSYKEQMDLYDKAYNYLGLLDRTKDAMKEATGRTLQAEGGRIGFEDGGLAKDVQDFLTDAFPNEDLNFKDYKYGVSSAQNRNLYKRIEYIADQRIKRKRLQVRSFWHRLFRIRI